MYPIILFDLDGTLTDPKPGITKCVQYALAKMGIEEPDCDKLTPFIGPPLAKAFMEFYQMDEQQAIQAIGYYRERFSTVGLYENSVYPGILELLGQLTAKGSKLVVATSKPTVFSVKILDYFCLSSYFAQVIGSNLDGTRVEKSEVIAFALSEIGNVNCESVIMVGDRKHDILGAKANGIDAIAVGYGYGSEEELRQATPKQIVQTVEELAATLLK
ncbi:MAG: 5-nucleotidase [Anaerosporomusa subterranea]|nr:5-nucleotidase [Anaerosporomusa subterranea]